MVTPTETRTLSEALPEAVVAVLNEFLTAELTTMGKGDRPVTWPIMPIYWAERDVFITLTSIGLPQKAFNIRRDPRVSLLFSEPIGSGLSDPPAVLVQGTAQAPDRVLASATGADPDLMAAIGRQARKMVERQPAMALYMRNSVTRYLMDWYFMRLVISIAPERISWWPQGDFTRRPETMEVTHVGSDPALFA